MCRFAAQLSVRSDVNSVAEEGMLLDKNGICRCRVGRSFTLFFKACLRYEYNKIYKITKTEMGSPCNENGEYKNYQKNNRMDAI